MSLKKELATRRQAIIDEWRDHAYSHGFPSTAAAVLMRSCVSCSAFQDQLRDSERWAS